MARNEYKGIVFAEGYKETFEVFKKTFENVHIFRLLPAEQKLSELKKAFAIANKEEKK